MTKILIAEDNEENWDMLSRRLERRGYDTVRAADGAEAVEKSSSEAPDLILMDLNLPVLDGWEATRTIRGAATGQDIPIIALTAHALAGDREKALAAGCNEYHTKPVELPRLLSQIEALLGKDTG